MGSLSHEAQNFHDPRQPHAPHGIAVVLADKRAERHRVDAELEIGLSWFGQSLLE